MPTNYQRGASRENYLKRKLEKQGFLVIRSAGSKSPIDLIAIHQKNRKILFLQVKPKKFSHKKREELMKQFNWLYGGFFCEYRIASTLSLYGIKFKNQKNKEDTTIPFDEEIEAWI